VAASLQGNHSRAAKFAFRSAKRHRIRKARASNSENPSANRYRSVNGHPQKLPALHVRTAYFLKIILKNITRLLCEHSLVTLISSVLILKTLDQTATLVNYVDCQFIPH
jgi:hypothetical protein